MGNSDILNRKKIFILFPTDDDVFYHDYLLLMHDHNEQIEHVFHVHQHRHHPYDQVHLQHHVFFENFNEQNIYIYIG